MVFEPRADVINQESDIRAWDRPATERHLYLMSSKTFKKTIIVCLSVFEHVRAYSQQTKVKKKAKNKGQTSKKIFAFVFAFVLCEKVLDYEHEHFLLRSFLHQSTSHEATCNRHRLPVQCRQTFREGISLIFLFALNFDFGFQWRREFGVGELVGRRRRGQ